MSALCLVPGAGVMPVQGRGPGWSRRYKAAIRMAWVICLVSASSGPWSGGEGRPSRTRGRGGRGPASRGRFQLVIRRPGQGRLSSLTCWLVRSAAVGRGRGCASSSRAWCPGLASAAPAAASARPQPARRRLSFSSPGAGDQPVRVVGDRRHRSQAHRGRSGVAGHSGSSFSLPPP